jgi:transcriptional regulator with XRE-family HTH domain
MANDAAQFIQKLAVLLEQKREQEDLSWRKFGKKVGLLPNTVSGWTEGTFPRADQLIKAIEIVGGSIDRALPYRGNGDEFNQASAAIRAENERLNKEAGALKSRITELEGSLRHIRATVDKAVPEPPRKRPQTRYQTHSAGAMLLNEGGEPGKGEPDGE